MNELITKIARMAVLDTDGVASLANPIDIFVLKKKDNYDVDVYLVVDFGVKIPEVAWSVQENIKKALNKENIDSVEHINIHVQGVKITEDR
ncbi:MAG: Asp23/Gls24 family envelope stress response protein [Bacillota bacterium]|nr:Asp23/Gls24 family envelope stress response protein [Bacillota bacterium]